MRLEAKICKTIYVNVLRQSKQNENYLYLLLRRGVVCSNCRHAPHTMHDEMADERPQISFDSSGEDVRPEMFMIDHASPRDEHRDGEDKDDEEEHRYVACGIATECSGKHKREETVAFERDVSEDDEGQVRMAGGHTAPSVGSFKTVKTILLVDQLSLHRTAIGIRWAEFVHPSVFCEFAFFIRKSVTLVIALKEERRAWAPDKLFQDIVGEARPGNSHKQHSA